jgi:hypothetical protein
MLDPGLQRVGIGFRSDANSSPVVMRLGTVIKGDINAAPILYPRNGQTGVVLAFNGEAPDPLPEGAPRPSGFPITCVVYGDAKLKDGWGTLTDMSTGQFVEAHVFSAEKPARADVNQDQSLVIFARVPLKHSTTYRADFMAKLNGIGAEQKWTTTFSTIGPGEATTVNAGDVASLDNGIGKIVSITGAINSAGLQAGDGAVWAGMTSPHSKGVFIWFTATVWANFKTKTGITETEQLVGRTVRVLGDMYAMEKWLNINVWDGGIDFV